jgi:hypothetical protein
MYVTRGLKDGALPASHERYNRHPASAMLRPMLLGVAETIRVKREVHLDP